MNRNAQFFENVRAAAERCHLAVTMLDHDRPARRQNEYDRRRDIEEIRSSATGPADIDHRSRKIGRIDHRIESAPHERTHEPDDLIRALALLMQGREKLYFLFVLNLVRQQKHHA
jgi:hypothetical protein